MIIILVFVGSGDVVSLHRFHSTVVGDDDDDHCDDDADVDAAHAAVRYLIHLDRGVLPLSCLTQNFYTISFISCHCRISHLSLIILWRENKNRSKST